MWLSLSAVHLTVPTEDIIPLYISGISGREREREREPLPWLYPYNNPAL